MGKTVKNSDLVPKEVIEQLKDLDAQLLSTTNSLKEMLVPVSEISTELSKSATNYKDLIDAINKLKTAEKQATETSRKRMDIEAQKRSIQEKIAQSTSAEAKELAKLRVQLQQQNQINKAAAKEALAHANSIEAMRLQLSKLKAEWAKLDVNSDKYKQMTADINKLNDEISKQEQSIGVWSRNVGNYSSAFNGLQFSINQVARELPSLTISASQFFLAISNNLPMLVDELKRAKDANKALREEGAKTVPVWKQLLKGIFSWQTALVVGITLLTAYGDEIIAWVKGLFTAEEALDSVAEAQKRINEASVEGAKNAKEELLRLEMLKNVAEDRTKSDAERAKAVDELQRLYPDYLGNISRESILTGEVSNSYKILVENIEKAAIAKAKFDKLVELSQESEQLESEYTDILAKNSEAWSKYGADTIEAIKGTYSELSKYKTSPLDWAKDLFGISDKAELEEIIKSYDKWQDKLKEIENFKKSIDTTDLFMDTSVGSGGKTTEQIDKERQAILEYYQLIYKDRAEYYKAVVSDERLSYEERQKALDKFTRLQLDAIKARKDAEIEALGGKGGTNEIALIEAKANSEYRKIWTERANIWKSIEGQRSKEAVTNYTREYEAQVKALSGSESGEMGDLAGQYTRGLVSKEDYERQKLEITRKYAEQEFVTEREYLTKILELTSITDEERLKFTEQLGDAELKYKEWLYNEDVKAYEDAQKKKEGIDKEKAKVREELLRSSFELAKALLQRDLENKIEKLDEESEANQEWRDEEAERIDRLEESGAISKEQADARKEAIDDQAQAREEEIEKKKVEAQRRMAIYEKATSIAQVAINTAQSISKTLALLGMPAAIPFIAMAAAAGAAQTAAIVATPLPQYEEGTMDHPGGLAIVGDGGRSEMIIANGKYYKTPATDTLVDLPKHAIVLPDFNKAAENLPDMPNVGSVVNVDFSRLEASTSENGKILKAMARRMEINAKNEIYEREFNRLKPSKR